MALVLGLAVTVAGLGAAFLLDARSPLAIDATETVTLAAGSPGDGRSFDVAARAAILENVTVLKWSPELNMEDADALVDIAGTWSGPDTITRLLGNPVRIMDEAVLDNVLFDGDFILIGEAADIEAWRAHLAREGIASIRSVQTETSLLFLDVYRFFPMLVVIVLFVVMLAALIPLLWLGLNSRTLALLTINGANAYERATFMVGSIALPVIGVWLFLGVVVSASLIVFGKTQLWGPVVGITGWYVLLACCVLSLSLFVLTVTGHKSAAVLTERRNATRGQLRLLEGAYLTTLLLVVVAAVPFSVVLHRGGEAEAKVGALEALPDSSVSLGLFTFPGDPLGSDPDHDAFLAAPLREFIDMNALSLANIWMDGAGSDGRGSLVVVDQSYVDSVGTAGLRGPLVPMDPNVREWQMVSIHLGRSASAQRQIIHDSHIYEVKEGSLVAAPRSQFFEYAPAGSVVAVLPSLDLLNDGALVAFGSNGSLLVSDLDLAESVLHKYRAHTRWTPFLLSDAGDSARDHRLFNRVAGLSTLLGSVMASAAVLLMITWLRSTMRREEFRMLILHGRSIPSLLWSAGVRELMLAGVFGVGGVIVAGVAYPVAISAVAAVTAGLLIMSLLTWYFTLTMLRRRIGDR
ncbi:hypothetical protein [Corynebacterium nasicanis]